MKEETTSDKILAALDNVHRAQPSEEFLTRMESITETYINRNQKVSTRSILGIAASFTLLVLLNISMLKKTNQTDFASSDESYSESAYNLVPTKSIYNE